ncbi:MAG: DUF484 family protein [Dehalococcoidia bacterium]
MIGWLTRNPVIVQVAAVGLATLALTGIGIGALAVVRDSASSASEHSRAALLAAKAAQSAVDAEALLRRAIPQEIVLTPTNAAPATAPAGVALPPLSTQPAASPTVTANPAPVAPPQPLTPDQALEIDAVLYQAEEHAEELHALVGTEATLELLGATEHARRTLDDYASAASTNGLRVLTLRLRHLRTLSSSLGPQLSAEAEADNQFLTETVEVANWALLGAVVVAGLMIGATTSVVVRKLSQALRASDRERATMGAAVEAARRRNEQFQSLYQVVTEITETLSLRYVVQTAVREARQLARADAADLRLLRQNSLEVMGLSNDGVECDLSAVELGSGLAGRVARRGRSIRLAEQAEAEMVAGERIPGIRSGVVVPLIVGARVVGTLGCWSKRPAAFDEEDVRILEMMASQVATAVVAADAHEATRHEAHHDPLTGLANRRRLNLDLLERLGPAVRDGQPFAVAMVDIDHFKRFNDEFGHRVGDITLQQVAGILKSGLREGDSVYRFGGEEFTLLIAEGDPEAVVRTLDRVRQSVSEAPYIGEDLAPVGPITVSIGVALGPAHSTDPDILMELADRALYEAKSAGRNRVLLHGDGSPVPGQVERLRILRMAGQARVAS